MTELTDYYIGMSLDKKEGQLVTCGIFYCRDSAEINGSGSLQTSSWFDSDVLRNRQQKHTAKPLSLSVKKPTRKWHIWFFPTHKPTLKKPKEQFFSNAIEKHFVILSKSSRFNFQDNGNKLWRVYQKT